MAAQDVGAAANYLFYIGDVLKAVSVELDLGQDSSGKGEWCL